MTESEQVALYAVITGDIVRSRRIELATLQAFPSFLRLAAKTWNKMHPDSLCGRIDVFRGDEWQAALQHPELALRFAIFIRASLKSHGLDTRVSIGIATVDFISPGRIQNCTGEAFVLSGHGLDGMNNRDQMQFAMPILTEEKAMRLVIQLTDTIIGLWTSTQADVMTWFLSGFTMEQISRRLSMSPLLVSHLLVRANARDIEGVLRYFQEIVANAAARRYSSRGGRDDNEL